ncbi:MAG: hypothetical protein ACKOKC_15860, partial [Chthoniobacterales bacterium]
GLATCKNASLRLRTTSERSDAVASWETAAKLDGASQELPAKLHAARGGAPSDTDEANAARP